VLARKTSDGKTPSAVQCGLNGGNVNLVHTHAWPQKSERLRQDQDRQSPHQDTGRDLRVNASAVLVPAAFTFLHSADLNDTPQPIGFCLIVRGNLERACLAVLKLQANIQAHARSSYNGELRQPPPLFALWEIAGHTMHFLCRTACNGLCIKLQGLPSNQRHTEFQGT
jgi:hypothetical protein